MKLPLLSKLFKKTINEADVVPFPTWRRKQRFENPPQPGIKKGKVLGFDPNVTSKEVRGAEKILREIEKEMASIGYDIIPMEGNIFLAKLHRPIKKQINIGGTTPFQILAQKLLKKGYKSGQQGDVLYKLIPNGIVEVWRWDWIDEVGIKIPISTKNKQMENEIENLFKKVFSQKELT